jgi:hypothetical protein
MRYPLECRFRPSCRLQLLIAAIHLIAAMAFLASSLAPALIAAVVAALAVSACLSVAGERRRAGLTVVLDDAGLLTLRDRGRTVCATPLPSCTDFVWAVWLHWRELAGGHGVRPRTGALMLLPDHVDATTWRLLRIWLRHKSAAAVSAVEQP